MAEQGFFSIGFVAEAGETAEKMIDALSTYCVAREIAKVHLEVGDTEPDGEICHQINERLCKPQLWQEYGRWTG